MPSSFSFWGCAASCLLGQGLSGLFLVQEPPFSLALLLLWPGLHHHPLLFCFLGRLEAPLPGFGLPLCSLVTLRSLPGSPPVDLGSSSLPQSVSCLPAPFCHLLKRFRAGLLGPTTWALVPSPDALIAASGLLVFQNQAHHRPQSHGSLWFGNLSPPTAPALLQCGHRAQFTEEPASPRLSPS